MTCYHRRHNADGMSIRILFRGGHTNSQVKQKYVLFKVRIGTSSGWMGGSNVGFSSTTPVFVSPVKQQVKVELF